jgi:hypothetical protein
MNPTKQMGVNTNWKSHADTTKWNEKFEEDAIIQIYTQIYNKLKKI